MNPPVNKRIVIALGGNAAYPPSIKGTAEEQLALMAELCSHFVRLIDAGYRIVLTHGNGPVVGNILFRMAKTADELPPMPMDVCVSHSQGGMGYMLQQSFSNVLRAHGDQHTVAALVTQVEVDPHDPAFQTPTKPIGKFFSPAEAAAMAQSTGWNFAEDAGRGWRRVVASPKPKLIVEGRAIEALIDAGIIPIVAGGGGIPVVQDAQGNYHGVPAVIDKDYTSAMLAAQLKADAFVMVTGVEHVALDFGKPTQRNVPHMSLQQAREYAAQGQFPAGSMGPKIGAAIDFLSAMHGGSQARHQADQKTHQRTGAAPTGRVIITSLNKVFDAVLDGAGTHITA